MGISMWIYEAPKCATNRNLQSVNQHRSGLRERAKRAILSGHFIVEVPLNGWSITIDAIGRDLSSTGIRISCLASKELSVEMLEDFLSLVKASETIDLHAIEPVGNVKKNYHAQYVRHDWTATGFDLAFRFIGVEMGQEAFDSSAMN
jgi:hypothetical protein